MLRVQGYYLHTYYMHLQHPTIMAKRTYIQHPKTYSLAHAKNYKHANIGTYVAEILLWLYAPNAYI